MSRLAGYTSLHRREIRMVRWYHLILTAYGFWLPNDPRGSWSDFVASWELYKFGPATKTSEKRSLAHDPHDESQRLRAKRALKYPPVRFGQRQRNTIAQGFGQAVAEGAYGVLACCIGHDHAHLVTERHERSIERIAQHLKSKATMALTRAGVHPLAAHRRPDGAVPSPWSEGIWSAFISDREHLSAAMEYVERHPLKEGLPLQKYPFMRPARV
ncbi:MAG TPA: hypothetical protein VNL70_05430 [Tepidisphaeraceae bacterium]|nr:hypothetical protein [Tepidisphaeraceae bacterium]